MNAAVYQEPYRLPAGILALTVHLVFFVLLYFGFSWQTQPAVAMARSVELWQSLPDAAPVRPKVPVVEKVLPPPLPVEVVKPEIVIPDKKPEKRIEVVKPVEKPKPEVKHEVKKVVQPAPAAPKMPVVSAAQQQAARDKAEQEAATGRVVDDAIGKIQSKIRRNVVMPPNVANDARAEFMVTLLPGGSVLNAHLTRSSGNTAYDNAVERAILKSDPLPLPSDTGLFSRFRELKLSFKPVE